MLLLGWLTHKGGLRIPGIGNWVTRGSEYNYYMDIGIYWW